MKTVKSLLDVVALSVLRLILGNLQREEDSIKAAAAATIIIALHTAAIGFLGLVPTY